jgi:hypothetical protein
MRLGTDQARQPVLSRLYISKSLPGYPILPGSMVFSERKFKIFFAVADNDRQQEHVLLHVA